MRRLLLLLLNLLWVALAGCSGPGRATDAASDDPDFKARKLYVAKCAKCHKLYDPLKYTDPQWQMWMEKMSKKAKLKADQREMLARYLDTIRAAKP